MGILPKGFVALHFFATHVATRAWDNTEKLRDPFRVDVCPTRVKEIRYGTHSLPKQIFYTGKTDGHLKDLTYGSRGAWPSDYKFVYYSNEAMDVSMQHLAGDLKNMVPGLYEAFSMLRPWAFKADLWRYCILWSCGGVYVDSKLAIAEPFDEFLSNVGFNPSVVNQSDSPQLYSCRDHLATLSMRDRDRVTCVWQGLLIAEPKSEQLLRSIRFVVEKIKARWYPTFDISKMPWLFLTGPGAMALATQRGHPDWQEDIKLNCRLAYTPNKEHGAWYERTLQNPHLVGDWNFDPPENDTEYNQNMSIASFVADAGLHRQQRTNSYGKLFKAHMVYMDDEWPKEKTNFEPENDN